MRKWGVTLLCWLLCLPGRGDEVALLRTGQDAAQARIDLIRDAAEIYVSTFILGNDTSGNGMLALLREAARRGARVHLLVDVENFHTPPEVVRHLLTDPELGGRFQIRVYNPFRWSRPWEYLARMHDKLFAVVDRRGVTHAISGGRNVADEYFSPPEARTHFQDTDLYVRGEAAEAVVRYFRELWDRPESVPPTGRNTLFSRFGSRPLLKDLAPEAVARAGEVLVRALGRLRELGTVRLDGPGTWRERLHSVSAAAFSHDDPSTRRGADADLVRMIRQARHTIDISNSYVILPDEIKAELKAAVRRGVRVRIVTNNALSNDVPIAQGAYENDLPRLLSLGGEIYEVRTRWLLHRKVMVVDGRLVYVGSFNLDPRSAYINLESGFIINDPALGAEVTRVIERDILRSVRLRRPEDALRRGGCFANFLRLSALVIRGQL